MEEIKSYYANFDFDITLLNNNYKKEINPNSKYNKSLQYLFFWTAEESDQLYVVDKKLRESYHDKIREYQSFVPQTTMDKSNLHYWWGDSSSLDKWLLEKEINSKFTSHAIEKVLGISIISRIGYHKNDIPENIKDYILKKDHGFSGQGVIKNLESIKYPILIEQKLKRKTDYGSIINDKCCHTFQNLVDEHGQYVATFLDRNNRIDIGLEEDLYKIFNKYKEKYNVTDLQIDSFSYYKDDKILLRPLCEVNHRKSMGWVTNKLNAKFGSDLSLFIIIPKHRISKKIDLECLFNTGKNEGVIQLSLPSELLQSFFITSNNYLNFKKYVSYFSEKFDERSVLSNFVSSM